jgi:hypothetical protein
MVDGQPAAPFFKETIALFFESYNSTQVLERKRGTPKAFFEGAPKKRPEVRFF